MTEAKSYVHTDSDGVMRVGSSGVMLDSILAGFERGDSPESIRSQYPALALEEVYGAITYYLAHQDEVHDYLRRQEAAWAHWQAKAGQPPNPLLARLRAARHSAAGQRPVESGLGVDHMSSATNPACSK